MKLARLESKIISDGTGKKGQLTGFIAPALGQFADEEEVVVLVVDKASAKGLEDAIAQRDAAVEALKAAHEYLLLELNETVFESSKTAITAEAELQALVGKLRAALKAAEGAV